MCWRWTDKRKTEPQAPVCERITPDNRETARAKLRSVLQFLSDFFELWFGARSQDLVFFLHARYAMYCVEGKEGRVVWSGGKGSLCFLSMHRPSLIAAITQQILARWLF